MSTTTTKNSLYFWDTFCNFIKICIENVLYSNKIYPQYLFESYNVYNTISYHTNHKDIREYIDNLIQEIYKWNDKRIKQIVLVLEQQQANKKMIQAKIIFSINKKIDKLLLDQIEIDKLYKEYREFLLKITMYTMLSKVSYKSWQKKWKILLFTNEYDLNNNRLAHSWLPIANSVEQQQQQPQQQLLE